VVNQQSFGRRINPQQQPRQTRGAAEFDAPMPSVELADGAGSKHLLPPAETEAPSIDDELREWKQSRNQSLKIPWRPLSFMASLCFGIASFVLPDSVNDGVQWLLYALIAISLFAGLAKRRETKG
jgi:hypothetical protein